MQASVCLQYLGAKKPAGPLGRHSRNALPSPVDIHGLISGILCWLVDFEGEPFPKKRIKGSNQLGNWDCLTCSRGTGCCSLKVLRPDLRLWLPSQVLQNLRLEAVPMAEARRKAENDTVTETNNHSVGISDMQLQVRHGQKVARKWDLQAKT